MEREAQEENITAEEVYEDGEWEIVKGGQSCNTKGKKTQAIVVITKVSL